MLPRSSRSGTLRWNIQRYSPSARRTRASYSKTSPDARQSRHFGHNPLNVLGMNEIRPIPAGHLFQSDAQVFQPRSIEVIEVAVGPGGVYQRRDRVDEKLNIQRLGLLSAEAMARIIFLFEIFPTFSRAVRLAHPVGMFANGEMLAPALETTFPSRP